MPPSSSGSDRAARIAEAKKQAAKGSRRPSGIWVALLGVLVLIGGLVGWAIWDSVANRPDLSAVQTYEDLSRDHVSDPPDYEQTPPAGGDHHDVWLNCGTYTEPVPDHHAVHSLEHGAVWLTYQPDLPQDQVEELTDLADQDYVILSPYEGQPSPVMATAWGHQLGVDSAEDARLEEFVQEYKQGPQTPEPGAACTGGTSEDLLGG